MLNFEFPNHPNGYQTFNYADKPDLPTKELIEIIEQMLGVNVLPFRISYWLGMLGGYMFDGLALLRQGMLNEILT